MAVSAPTPAGVHATTQGVTSVGKEGREGGRRVEEKAAGQVQWCAGVVTG
jgi:hypothetical protein